MGVLFSRLLAHIPIRELTNDDKLIGQLFGWTLDQRNLSAI